MAEEKLKAIVLRAVPFKDRQSILTLLSEEKGIVSMIVKGLSKSRPHLVACINPLCEAEFIYTEGRSDLLKCLDASVIDTHFPLREKYSYLQQGMQLAKILLQSQCPGKATPSLYALLSRFLKQIPSFKEALPSLSSSFLLKLLKHEGLLQLDPSCSVCCEQREVYSYGGEIYCKRHAPSGSFSFSEREWKILELLADASSFQVLREIPLENAFREKIELYFQTRIKQL